MRQKPKTIYRARYTIDIEFTDEARADEAGAELDDADLAEIVKVTLVSAERDLANMWPSDDHRFDYVEKHFPWAVTLMYFTMLWAETFIDEWAHPRGRRIVRNMMLKAISRIEDKNRRKRIPAKPPADKRELDLRLGEREEFIAKCLDHMRQIESERGRVPKQSLAIKLGPGRSLRRDSNIWQILSRQLAHYGVTYSELEALYEQKR